MNTTVAPGLLLWLLQDGPGGGGLLLQLLPIIIIFFIFYLLIIRPQQKRQRQAQAEREKMLNALKPGDKIITSGGIYGTVVAVRDERVQLRIAQSVAIEMQRNAIAAFQSSETEAEVKK